MLRDFEYISSNNANYYTIPLFEQTDLVKTCFTAVPHNMGFQHGNDRAIVLENYRLICQAIGIQIEQLVLGHQVHGDGIQQVYKTDKGKGIIKESDIKNADGLITGDIGVALVTLYADCVPLFFLDPVHKAIGLSHAGWRGTVASIGPKTLEAMRRAFNTQPQQCLAAIGPSIGPCCFEVDEPVAAKFMALLGNDTPVVAYKGYGKFMVDLWRANALLLMRAGMLTENIVLARLCTVDHPQYFFSYRRSKGETGRMAAIIMLKE